MTHTLLESYIHFYTSMGNQTMNTQDVNPDNNQEDLQTYILSKGKHKH